MNFTILFPTRERVDLLTNLLRSINDTTIDKNNLEVLAGYDHDDGATGNVIHQLQHNYPWFKGMVRARGSNITRDYHNWLYRQSKGRFVIVINDDTAFRTRGWDQLALRKLSTYLSSRQDGVVYGWISDSLITRANGMNYCCFPLISRAAADVVGYVMHDHYGGWNADIHVYQLYNSIGRICDLSEIWIDHISYHSGKRARDTVSMHMQDISNGGHVDIEPDRIKLARHISNYKYIPPKLVPHRIVANLDLFSYLKIDSGLFVEFADCVKFSKSVALIENGDYEELLAGEVPQKGIDEGIGQIAGEWRSDEMQRKKNMGTTSHSDK